MDVLTVIVKPRIGDVMLGEPVALTFTQGLDLKRP